MHRAAVVPKDQVMGLPDVAVLECRLRHVLDQRREEARGLILRQPFDAQRKAGVHVKRLATGFGVGADHRVDDLAQLRLLGVGQGVARVT